jgi:AcrR family transcriptional regulator
MSAAAGVAAPEREAWRADGELAARLRVSEIQRSRLLSAAVCVIDEEGYGDASVAHITSRARVSRRTFYELFEDREACLLGLLEDAIDRVEREIAAAGLDGLPWRERVRGGLWRVLSFFDRDPALARVCVVQSAHGGERILKRRAAVLARMVSLIDEGRCEGARGAGAPSLTAEGLVGAAHAIVHGRLQARDPEPLSVLLGELMAMIVLPYLGASAARREQARALPEAARPLIARDARESTSVVDSLAGIPMRVTYRTALVLACLAEHPGISNRMVGDSAGIPDQGQISKLLSRLERLGLAANRGEGYVKGEANAWRLTPTGLQVAQSIRVHTHGQTPQGSREGMVR